jgi:succinate-semialdehyde dehydrogenase/glutarate-semialdehyde dehydrogenase
MSHIGTAAWRDESPATYASVMSERSAQPGPPVAGPADPELDPAGSYALDPRRVDRMLGRVHSSSGDSRPTYAPFTGQPLAHVPLSTPSDVASAAAIARATQATWAATDLRRRAEVLLNLHDLVLDRQRDIIDLVQWESGKARKHAFEEVAHVAMTARYYARTARRHLDSTSRLGLYPGLTRVRVNRVPKGVVGIISPWNYPFTMALSDGLPALLAGNAIVHKPDSQTVLSALLGVELLEEAGMPADAWQIVSGPGPTLGPALIDNSDYICFTGSTRTGRTVAARAAERLVGCSLELGGKNPMLVLRDAGVARAAEGAVRACFSSAGQLCVSMERMYIADEIYDRFVEAFVKRVESMRLAADFSYETDMGSLISQAQLDTVTTHVSDAVAKGARVLTGGKARPDVGPLFYEPTVLDRVDPRMNCFDNETFGPVVSLYRFTDEADAIERANQGSYGLSASIYSRDVERARALARRIRCGTVNINEAYGASFGSIDAPMGGMRESGLGRRQGPEGIHRYTEPQAVAAQRLVRFAPMLGMSDETYVKLQTSALRLLKKAHRP